MGIPNTPQTEPHAEPLNTGIVLVGSSGTINSINSAAANMLGVSPAAAAGLFVLDLATTPESGIGRWAVFVEQILRHPPQVPGRDSPRANHGWQARY